MKKNNKFNKLTLSRPPEELTKVMSFICKKIEETLYSINKNNFEELKTNITYNDIILSLSKLIALYSFYLGIDEKTLKNILNNITSVYNKMNTTINREKFIKKINDKEQINKKE